MIKILFVMMQIGLVVLFMSVMKKITKYVFFERIVRSIIYITLINIVVGMLLAIIGCYSLCSILIIDGLLAIFFYLICLKKGYFKDFFLDVKQIKEDKFVILCFGMICILYFAFPTNYMLGGRDPGLYYLNGIHISQTGGYQYDTDGFLNENHKLLEGIISPGYPGIYSDYEYGYSDKFGDLSPQFMPMYASAMAIGYDIGGISALIRVNCWITILSLLMIYLFLRRFFSKMIGICSVLLLAISPAQLWYGRNSVSEILLQLIIFLSIDLFAQGFEKGKKAYGVFAGLFLGLGTMDRIDAYILGVGLIMFLIYALLFSKKRVKYASFAVVAYGIVGIATFYYGITYSKQYFYDHMKNFGSLSKILLLNIILLSIAIIIYCIKMFISKRLKSQIRVKTINMENYIFKFFQNPKKVLIFFGVLMFIWIYAYVVRSMGISVDDPTYFIKHNIVELSWYVSPLIMVLSNIGLIGILYKKAEKRENIFLFLMLGMSNYIGYGINPYISKDHIWAARRWVTIIIPFLFITGVLGIRFLYRWCLKKNIVIAKCISIFLLIVIFGFSLYQSKSFLTVSIMENIDTQVESLANQLKDNVLYITNNEEIASYLRYIYHKRVYYSDMKEMEAIQNYILEEGELYYIGDYASVENLECEKKLVLFFQTQGQFLEKTIGTYPQSLYNRTREASIYWLYD